LFFIQFKPFSNHSSFASPAEGNGLTPVLEPLNGHRILYDPIQRDALR
jgi:hypothetical protein